MKLELYAPKIFNINVADAFNHISNKTDKTNILHLAGLRRSIPSSLRDKDCLSTNKFSDIGD